MPEPRTPNPEPVPAVSIIIPTHNRGELLMQTIASVRAQTFADFECVVVNDHSTDDMLARLAPHEAEDARITHIDLPDSKRGAQAARNAGIAIAKGEYLILLDSDDLLARHCLEQRVAFMNGRTDLDAAVYGCEMFRKTPHDVGTRWNIYTDENDLDRLLKMDVPWQTTSPIWRTESIRKVGAWDESVPVAQDWIFHIQALLKGIQYVKHDDIDHHWRMAAEERESIGKDSIKPDMVRARAEVTKKVLQLVKDAGALTEPRKRAIGGVLFMNAERLALKVSRREARELWQYAIDQSLVPTDVAKDGKRYFRWFHYKKRRAHIKQKIDRTWPADIPTARSRTSLVCSAGATPTISVVLPAYNAARYLRQAIDSILNQTWRDFELIVVDDGSTDDTLSILRDYERRDARMRPISRPNTGQTVALNDGVAAARGEFIARMDGDDIALPTRFEKELAFMRAHPDVLVVSSSVELIDPYDIPIGIIEAKTTHDEIDAVLMAGSGGAIVHPCAMIRKSAFEKVGVYRVQHNGSEDLDLWLRMAEAGRVANLPDVLLKYRRHTQSYSYAKNKVQFENKSRILAEAYDRRGLTKPAEWNFDHIWRPLPPDEQLRIWGWKAVKLGRVDAARGHARALVKLKPWSLGSWRLMYCAWRGR